MSWRWNEYYKNSNLNNCEDKIAFNSYSEAARYNNRAPRFIRGNKRKEKLRVYRCFNCEQWHLGHYPK